jgi:hypothetical protein
LPRAFEASAAAWSFCGSLPDARKPASRKPGASLWPR